MKICEITDDMLRRLSGCKNFLLIEEDDLGQNNLSDKIEEILQLIHSGDVFVCDANKEKWICLQLPGQKDPSPKSMSYINGLLSALLYKSLNVKRVAFVCRQNKCYRFECHGTPPANSTNYLCLCADAFRESIEEFEAKNAPEDCPFRLSMIGSIIQKYLE